MFTPGNKTYHLTQVSPAVSTLAGHRQGGREGVPADPGCLLGRPDQGCLFRMAVGLGNHTDDQIPLSLWAEASWED